MKAKEDIEGDLANMTQNFEESESARLALREQLEEASRQIKSQQSKNSKFQELVVEENSNWNLMD